MCSIKDTFETHAQYIGRNSISSRNSSPAECIKLLLISPPYLILSSCSVNIRSSGFERSPTWKVTGIGYISIEYRLLRSCYVRGSIFRETKGVESMTTSTNDISTRLIVPGEEETTPRSLVPVVTHPRSCCRVASWSRIFATVSKQKLNNRISYDE